MTKRWIALLLVLSMLLLPACTKKEKTKTAAQQFLAKAEKLESADSLQMKLTMTADKVVGTYHYQEGLEVKADFAAMNSETPIAQVKTKETINDASLKYEEQYIGGKAYMTIDGEDYICEISFADYLNNQYPLVLLNPNNYKSVTYDKASRTYHFKEATAAEDWLGAYHTQLQSAEGTATVDSDGALAAMTYTAQYVQGPVAVNVTYNLTLGETSLKEDDLDPEEDGLTTTDLSIPYLVNRSEMAMELEAPVSANQTTTIMSQLVGCYYSMYTQMDSYADDNQTIAKISDSLQVEDAYEAISMELVRLYKDGKSTVTIDGEETEAEEKSFEEYQEYIWAELSGSLMREDWMENTTLTPVSDYWLIEYDLAEDAAEYVEAYASYTLVGSENAMAMYVDELESVSMKGWMSVDMDTLLPVSVGLSAELTEVAEGYDCLLTVDTVYNMEFGDPDAYEAIMEDPIPDTEPENKPTPLLYEVTDGNGGKMYLFGTIHVGDDATAFLPDYVTNALKDSDYLGLEMNTDTLEDRMDTDEKLVESYMAGMMYSDGTLTADVLSEETAKALDQLIKATGKQLYMEYYLPAALSSYFSYNALDAINGLDQSKGVEDRLIKIAEDNGVEIIEIEDVHEHLALYGNYSEKTQVFILEDSLEIYRFDVLESLREMYEAWCRGDEAELIAMIREEEEPEEPLTEEEQAALDEYNNLMTVERDALMIEKAEEYLASGDTVFFAVGLAHVLGETGLVDALRAAGYTVTLISA